LLNERSVCRAFVELTLAELDPGERHPDTNSSVNYKDASPDRRGQGWYAAFPAWAGWMRRECPPIPTMRASRSATSAGHRLGMGMDHDGGFAEYVRVPADWVVPLPQGLTMFEAMALGTAGLAAALGYTAGAGTNCVPKTQGES